jgi:hypothetical protein
VSGCVPNQQNSCGCAGGETGYQVCNAEGTGYEKCECAGTTEGGTTEGGTTEGGTTEGTATGEICNEKTAKKCKGSGFVWVDSCGNEDANVTACSEGSTCKNNGCVSDDFCEPKVKKLCHKGNVWWFDSCDNAQSGAEVCEAGEFCTGCTIENPDCGKAPQCVKPYYNGTWKLEASPNTKDACGLGSSTYATLYLDLKVDGSKASATASFAGEAINYTGTVTGNNILIEATYSQSNPGGGTIDHITIIDATFVAPDKFEGIDKDHFELDLLGQPLACDLFWNVTGTKQ